MNLRLCRVLALIALAAATVGCDRSGHATVTGNVKRADGSPIVGARVIARDEQTGTSRTGETDSQGAYELGESSSADGVPPGNYSVVVLPERLSLSAERGSKRVEIPEKYQKHSTSGLTFSVQTGEEKQFDITLEGR
jgi:hypothetical protein